MKMASKLPYWSKNCHVFNEKQQILYKRQKSFENDRKSNNFYSKMAQSMLLIKVTNKKAITYREFKIYFVFF